MITVFMTIGIALFIKWLVAVLVAQFFPVITKLTEFQAPDIVYATIFILTKYQSSQRA